MKKFDLFLIVSFFVIFIGCDEDKAKIVVKPSNKEVAPVEQRFTAESHGIFEGGYNDNTREIFIITDKSTGKQYLAVTGCGTTELYTTSDGNGGTHTHEE